MSNTIKSIGLERLIPHPDNPNEMSKSFFKKLVCNIERTGRYEPLVVRPHPESSGCFQIINGHHRWQGLMKLEYKNADCVVWEIDDEQTNIFLATLNRLCGADRLGKKLLLLRRLSQATLPVGLAKVLPQTKTQIERLANLKMPARPAKSKGICWLNPIVFFLDDSQRQIVENALSLVEPSKSKMTKAAKNARGLVSIAQHFLNDSNGNRVDR